MSRIAKRERLFTSSDTRWYSALSGLLIVGIVYTFVPFLSLAVWKAAPFSTAFVFAIAALCIASACGRWAVLPQMRRPEPVEAQTGLRVAVLTAYVASSEPLEMLEQTLRAFVALRYPHDCWLLNEENDPAARSLCEEIGVKHFSRLDRPEYQAESERFQSRSKHGNYNAWLAEIGFSRYDVVTAFDVDHVPAPSFLQNTLGYLRDPKVGYVQAPQAYYNVASSLISRGAAEETYDFYSTIQMASYAVGYPILIGCHNTHRVEALFDVGGFAAHDADDLLLTLQYRRKRWEGVYVPVILARGVTPVDWDSYLIQQRRWARSVSDLKFHHQPRMMRDLPMFAKLMSYLQGVLYLQPAFIGALWFVLLFQALFSGQYPPILQEIGGVRALILCLALTLCYLFRQRFFLDPSTETGLHFRARLLRVAKSPFMFQGILDVLRGGRFEYVMTAKNNPSGSSKKLLSVFGTILLIMTGAWAVGVLSAPAYPLALHFVFAAIFSLCLGLILSEATPPSPAFDANLLRTAWTSSDAYSLDEKKSTEAAKGRS